MPKAAEWKTATPFRFNHGLRSTCDAERVREWVRLICHETGTIIAPLAGPTEGFVGNVLSPSRAMPVPNYHLIIFPVRRGERRLIEVHPGAVGGYDDTLWVGQSWYLSSQWNEGEEPILTAQNR